MKAIRCILMWAVVFSGSLYAGTVYTYQDGNGGLVISDRPPPESAKVLDVTRYTPATPAPEPAPGMAKIPAPKVRQTRQAAAEARQQALQTRKAADQAVNDANRAIAEANRLQEELGVLALKRKKYQLQIDRARKHALKKNALAKQALDTADQAEKEATAALAEAQKAAGGPAGQVNP